MNTDDLVTTIKEAFGEHPVDVLANTKMAVDGLGWLNEIFVSIEREAEGRNCSLRIGRLAAAGIYLAGNLEDFCGGSHTSWSQKLQDVGILLID